MRYKEFAKEFGGPRKKWFYHGTSSIYLPAIKKKGLQPQEGQLYITASFRVAKQESYNTTFADYGYGWDSGPAAPGVGGNPIVLKLDPKFLPLDNIQPDAEYSEDDYAFEVYNDISPKAIISVTQFPAKPTKAVMKYWKG